MQDRNQEQQQQPANASNEISEDQEQVSSATRGLSATYSPEDNKIRIRSVHRLDADTYARVKAAGFSWAPKQQLFVAPMWTPGRADLALELCGEIGDEDTTLVERAEERADRFEDYSEKRAREANTAREAVDAIAEHIPLGQPILIGHHSESRARKDAERIASGMRKAVQLWDRSAYWTERAKGALRAAKYRELPDVRARRIRKLEAEQRKQQRIIDGCALMLKLWNREGLTHEQAVALASRDGITVTTSGARHSLYSLLCSNFYTAEQAARAANEAHGKHVAWAQRWADHYANRLAYERAMLEEQGGTAADQTKPEKGGAVRCWCSPRGGWSYIKRVNKVTVTVEDNWGNGGRNFTRTIPFDALSGLMTAADVAQARSDGRLTETADAVGFYLAAPLAPEPEAMREAAATQEEMEAAPSNAPRETEQQPAGESPAASFERLREQLAKGPAEIITAPQLYPTPAALAERMVDEAGLRDGMRWLEPSAGTGAILQAVQSAGINADATIVEVNPGLCRLLRQRFGQVIERDFLTLNPDDSGIRVDRVILNPPFAPNAADIEHIEHARKFLLPGGVLVAICANGPRQAAKLRPIAEESGGYWEELPEGTFKHAGTNVRTALLVIRA